MSGLWSGLCPFGMGIALAEAAGEAAKGLVPPGGNQKREVLEHVKDMQQQLRRMALLNQALWELLCEKLNLSDQDLEEMVAKIGTGSELP